MIDVAIYGGAAIMLTWDMRKISGDVDDIVMDATHKKFVKTAVKQIAEEMSLHEDWFNDAVKGFISENQTMEELAFLPEREEGGLRIYVPTAEYLLAMKCLSMRWNLDAEEKGDREDIKNLLRKMDIKEPRTACNIIEKYYPSNLIKPRVSLGVQVLLEEISQENAVSSHTVSRIDSKGCRPDRIADIVPHARYREAEGITFMEAFSLAKREFLDSFYGMDDPQRSESLQDEPERISPLEDANLAAMAEQLAINFRLPIPKWTNQPCRFLHEPHFSADGVMKGILLRESPTAFRRRGLFVTGNVLSRASIMTAKHNHGEPVPVPVTASSVGP